MRLTPRSCVRIMGSRLSYLVLMIRAFTTLIGWTVVCPWHVFASRRFVISYRRVPLADSASRLCYLMVVSDKPLVA